MDIEKIISEVGSVGSHLMAIYSNENDITRIQDHIEGLKKKQSANDEAIAMAEIGLSELISHRNELLQIKSHIDTLININKALSPLRASLVWLAEEYPETRVMPLDQVLNFIATARNDIITKQDKLKEKIRGYGAIESKFNSLCARRELLAEKIALNENELDKSIHHTVKIKQDLNDVLVLQKIASRLKDYIKNEATRQIVLDHVSK